MKSLAIKELEKTQNKSEEVLSEITVMREVQKLLADDSQRDRQVLKAMGLDTRLAVADTLMDHKLTLEKMTQLAKGKVFHRDTIEKLCIDYRLRFLKTEFYKGAVDAAVPGKIREFEKETGIKITEAHLQTRFFILAPPSEFRLDKIVIPKRKSALRNFLDALASDPLMFFQIEAGSPYFRLVHKWGNDFSIMRAIKGFRWRSEGSYWLFGTLIGLAIAALIIPAVSSPASVYTWGYWIKAGLVGFAIGLIHYLCNVKNQEFISENLTENNWNNSSIYS